MSAFLLLSSCIVNIPNGKNFIDQTKKTKGKKIRMTFTQCLLNRESKIVQVEYTSASHEILMFQDSFCFFDVNFNFN